MAASVVHGEVPMSRALTFASGTAAHVAQYFRTGTRSTMSSLLDGAGAVLGAVQSFVDVEVVRAMRDGLVDFIPVEKERLAVCREQLASAIKVAEEEVDQQRDTAECVARLVVMCSQAHVEVLAVFAKIGESDLPDMDSLDRLQDTLTEAWEQFCSAVDSLNVFS